MFHYSISPDIFRMYPGYVRGVVIVRNLQNGPSPVDLLQAIRLEENNLRGRYTLDTLAQEPKITSWREAFRKFGAKPSEFRCSIEAMSRRVLRGESIPSINTLVDIGNLFSLRHLIPVGGHAIDHLEDDISLRLASGEEMFIPLGESLTERPQPGEVIFTEGNTVLTRRWTWRQGTHTLTLPETTAIEFNVDGLPSTTASDVISICEDLKKLVVQYCGGMPRIELLDEFHATIELLA